MYGIYGASNRFTQVIHHLGWQEDHDNIHAKLDGYDEWWKLEYKWWHEDKISDIATVATLFPLHTLFGSCEV